MTKFEYKIEVIDKKGKNLVEFLNEKGEKGWETVQVQDKLRKSDPKSLTDR